MARILVIDDDAQIRELLRVILERAGYEAVTAPDGKVGTRMYREEPADLVITDLIMPQKEGIETIIELRRDFPGVKIIVISGGGTIDAEEYLRMAKTLGAQRIFSKPFGMAEMLEAVQELLR